MLPIRKILLPVDFSDRARGAAHLARVLAERFHAEMTMIHVVPPPDYSAATAELSTVVLDRWNADKAASARCSLDAFLREEFSHLPVHRSVLEGDAATEIVDFAHRENSDLIVLPTHGYGRFRRFVLGSVTAKVLHDAECPVLTGTHIAELPETPSLDIRRVLCALDLGPNSQRALQYASQLAGEFGARLTVVHAFPPKGRGQIRYFDAGWMADLEKSGRAGVEELLRKAGAEAELILEHGEVPDVVDGAANRTQADLLVIARSASAGLIGRFRQNAYAIVRQSPCPVISV